MNKNKTSSDNAQSINRVVLPLMAHCRFNSEVRSGL